MKPALHYAIRKDWDRTVIAVTSEQTGRRHDKWHGRNTKYNESTHGTTEQLQGRFKTQAQAEAVSRRVLEIRDEYDAKRKPHNDAVTQLYTDERNAMNAAIEAGSDA